MTPTDGIELEARYHVRKPLKNKQKEVLIALKILVKLVTKLKMVIYYLFTVDRLRWTSINYKHRILRNF